MKLHYKELGNGKPLIILHGLFGMLDNWLTPAKTLAENFRVILVDQRNHGHSPHHSAFNYSDMSEDILELIHELDLDEVLVLGHSMGGKTAMKFAQHHPDYVEKLIVVDIGPKFYPIHHEVILKGLNALDFSVVKTRAEAEKILSEFVPNSSERQFLMKNLYWIEKNKLAWRFNLGAITEQINNVGEELFERRFEKPVLFIKGQLSNYIKPEDGEGTRLVFPHTEIVEIPNAGHWVHAEQPQLFLKTVEEFLR